MKAMIFAAGLGTRLKPLTDTMPKALVPVAGKPMLEHVIRRLIEAGCAELIINIHHFGEQILDFLATNSNFGITIHISDERKELLDTGGGIKKASEFFTDDTPLLIHNVDILSNVDLRQVYENHLQSDDLATLVVSERKTARYLVFDKTNKLEGWMNVETQQTKPSTFRYDENQHTLFAFSGIHVISPRLVEYMNDDKWSGKFSITDFYVNLCSHIPIRGYVANQLQVIDIGKPETLKEAEKFISKNL